MVRIKAGALPGEWPRTYLSPAVTGARAAARARVRLRAALARVARSTEEPWVGRRPAGPGADRRPVRLVLALALPTMWGATAITYKLVCTPAQQNGRAAQIFPGAVFLAVGTGLTLHARRVFLRELQHARAVADAAQSTLLRPLPARIDGLATAAAQLSADRGAAAGGDLYEVIATEHGVRVVMGDVRGHGLGAVGTVAAVLGSFREAAHDEAELASVLRRLERTLARHLRECARATHPFADPDSDSPVAEEFVTLLLLEIRPDGEVLALNCGHPWPYLLSGDRVEPLAGSEPLPPLGPFPLPAELPATDCGRLLPGEALFLHTDGVADARDAHGRFFPLPAALTDAVRTRPVSPQSVLRAVFSALLRHTGGRPTDDVALLVLHNDRLAQPTPAGGPGSDPCDSVARARPAATHPQPTNHL